MPIQTTHPEYAYKVDTWSVIDNVLNGDAKQYIHDIEPIYPQNSPMYDGARNYLAVRSCKLYREGAVFVNFSLQTLNAIVALALNVNPTYDLPPALEYMQKNSTGNKLSLDQLIQKLISKTVSVGRIAMFTDYPSVDPTLDRAAQQDLQLGPRIYLFNAEAVINWKTREVNGVEQLSLVVIRKYVEVENQEDVYSQDKKVAYLVLQLDADGYYTQMEVDNAGKTIKSEFHPLKNGQKFTEIPLTFVGSENNDPNCDICPLESLVGLNIGHLRNSAVYEDNLKKYGRGTLTITSSLPADDWQKYYENRPIVLGVDEGYFLGESGEFKIAQLQPAQEAATAMNQKQEQMVMLGAHIVTGNQTNVSTETTKLNMSEKISMLNTIVGNVEDALNQHLGYCDEFMGGVAQESYVEMSREFIEAMANPLVIAQLLAAINGGAVPRRILIAYLQSVGLVGIHEDVEALSVEADNENPLSNIGFNANPIGADV